MRDNSPSYHSVHTDLGVSVRVKLAMEYALKYAPDPRNHSGWAELKNEANPLMKQAFVFADAFLKELEEQKE